MTFLPDIFRANVRRTNVCRAVLRSMPAMYLLVVIVPLLGIYGLWFDEIFSVTQSRDISSLLDMVRTQENNMLLHYILLWLWMPLGDGSEIFLRLLSVLLVLLSLLPLHAAVRRLSGETVASTACLLYVSHFLVLQHTQACRGYALALLMTTLVLWRWVCAWQTQKRGDWLLAGVLAGLSVWAHYFSALVIPVLLCAMLFRDGFRQPWSHLVLAGMACVVMALPVILTLPPDGAAQIAWADVPDKRVIVGTLWMLGGSDGLYEQPLLLAALALVVGALLIRKRQDSLNGAWRTPAAAMTVGLLLVVALVLLESFWWQPLFVYRFFTPLVPLYCFVLAAGLCLLRPWLRVLLVALTLLVSAWETWKPVFTEPVPVRYWWKPMVQKMIPYMKPGDVLLVYPAFLRMPVAYYLDKLDTGKRLPRPLEYSSGYYRQGGGVEPAPDWQHLQQAVDNTSGNVWLIADEKPIPSWLRLNRVHAPALRQQLLQHRERKVSTRYATLSVERFDKPVTAP